MSQVIRKTVLSGSIGLVLAASAYLSPSIAQGGCERIPLYNQYALIGQQDCCPKHGVLGVSGTRCRMVYRTGTIVDIDCDRATMFNHAQCRYYVNGRLETTCAYIEPSILSAGGTQCN